MLKNNVIRVDFKKKASLVTRLYNNKVAVFKKQVSINRTKRFKFNGVDIICTKKKPKYYFDVTARDVWMNGEAVVEIINRQRFLKPHEPIWVDMQTNKYTVKELRQSLIEAVDRIEREAVEAV